MKQNGDENKNFKYLLNIKILKFFNFKLNKILFKKKITLYKFDHIIFNTKL